MRKRQSVAKGVPGHENLVQLNLRVDREQYNSLKLWSQISGQTLNVMCGEAIHDYLVTHVDPDVLRNYQSSLSNMIDEIETKRGDK